MAGDALTVSASSAARKSRAATVVLFGGAAAAVLALHLATNGTLGFHTDELYYLDAGRHPALGYVDFPPIVPLLARLETGLLGTSPWTLRFLPSLLGAFMVVLSGLYVRRLGGSLRLQALALATAIAAPFFLGANWVFQTVTFDQVAWTVALYWFLCLVVDRRPRYWIYLGVTLGIGLEVKYTIAGLIAGIVVAVLATTALRAQVRTRYPWIGVALALLIWSPNLAWQVTEGFPSLAYVLNHSGSGGGPAVYLIEIGAYFFFLLPVWLAGLVSLVRNPVLRPIGIACVFPLLLFLFVGKSYYAAGTIPVAVAQGIMAISRVKRPRLRNGLQIAVVVASVLEFVTFLQLTVPITPPDRLHATGLDAKNEVFADSVGWDEIAHQVASIYQALPEAERSSSVIVSAYYGVPGALNVYESSARLPAAVSPQLSDWFWLPDKLDATYALMVDYEPSDVGWMCTSATLLTRLTVPYQVKGLEQNAPVTLCQLSAPLKSDWARLRNFS